MKATLYRGGHVYSAAAPQATALLVSGDRIAWLGDAADAPAADEVVELDGALVAPAFVDAHVHATNTGVALSWLDLSQATSAAALLDTMARAAAELPAGVAVLGHGWDESKWTDQRLPTLAELDASGAGRQVYLTQASMHSALCSSATLAAVPHAAGLPGYDESGLLRREAHHAIRHHALGAMSREQRGAAQEAALRRAASLGIAAIHECAGPGTSSESDLTDLLARSGAAHGHPEVYGYWGELMSAAKARELGAVGAGGDLYADGALGARTAHLSQPYLDIEGGICGHGYLSADQVAAHIVDCADHGMQGGFHAIGDQALATVLAGYRAAAATVGLERLRAGRHRIEHVELVDKQMIATLVELGLVASMQPAFDRLWGGEHQMYAQRLGVARALETNPMGAMRGVGVALAFGSDSPVTPLDPWGAVRAAMWHFNPAYRMRPRAAFAAHTRGGWRAVGQDDEGALAPGAAATFAVWRTPAGLTEQHLPVLEPGVPVPTCLRTVLRGILIYSCEPEER